MSRLKGIGHLLSDVMLQGDALHGSAVVCILSSITNLRKNALQAFFFYYMYVIFETMKHILLVGLSKGSIWIKVF